MKSNEMKVKSRFPAFQRHPRNCWYVAAGASEIGDKPLGREIHGEKLVFFRDAEGKVTAARDACPHRGFPLSKSFVWDGVLQCGYHGIQFDGSGKCVGIPNNPDATITPKMCLKTYPVVEKWLFVWIWMGDPDLADPSLIPDIDCQSTEGYEHYYLSPVGPHLGNAQLLRENLCDSTHVSYLHASLVDKPDNTTMITPRHVLYSDDEKLLFGADMPGFVADEDSAAFFNLEIGKSYHFRQQAWHYIPGLCVVHSRFHLPEDPEDFDNLGPVVSDHTVPIGLTPANDREYYHMTALSTNLPQTEKMRELLMYVIYQDVHAAEDIQSYYEQHWDEAVEVSVPSDHIAVLIRRKMNKMVETESQQVVAEQV